MQPPAQTTLAAHASDAQDWLFNAALPVWWEAGFDRDARCFAEMLDADGRAPPVLRRTRVQARQTFVYAAAARLGWSGPWREAVEAGVAVLTERVLREDGGTTHLLGLDGRVHDARRDLYDAAFVIFALAHAGDVLQRRDLVARAGDLADWIFAHWDHPMGGLLEGEVTPTPPRRQNPHMHVLEALLALYEVSGDATQMARAKEIVALMRTRFYCARRGVLLEYFNNDWSVRENDEGRIAEPGHQFEWAWLLSRFELLSGESTQDVADALYAYGENQGVNARGFTVDETWAEGGVRAPTSRLWPNTERIKANLVRFEASGEDAAIDAALQACDALNAYLDPSGLWRDRRDASGAIVSAPAPASSFYHIMMAYLELMRVAQRRL